MKRIGKPKGIFKGKNFMTPNILAYYRIRKGLYAEISEGTGFTDNQIIGVTIHDATGNDTGKSKMVYSEDEAMKYLKSV